MFCLYGYILFQFWFHPFPFPNDHNFHIGLPYTKSHLPVTLKKQEAFDVLMHFKPLCHSRWYTSRTAVTRSHYWFVEVPSCFFSWCKFTIEQIYCNLCVNLCFPAEWERGQQNSNGRLETAMLHIQHPDSQQQGKVRKPNHAHSPSNKPIDDQKNNSLKTNITRNLLTDGQIYTPCAAALLWRCAFTLLHCKVAAQGCWGLALSEWNRDYAAPYVRQLKQRIPGPKHSPFPSGREH